MKFTEVLPEGVYKMRNGEKAVITGEMSKPVGIPREKWDFTNCGHRFEPDGAQVSDYWYAGGKSMPNDEDNPLDIVSLWEESPTEAPETKQNHLACEVQEVPATPAPLDMYNKESQEFLAGNSMKDNHFIEKCAQDAMREMIRRQRGHELNIEAIARTSWAIAREMEKARHAE